MCNVALRHVSSSGISSQLLYRDEFSHLIFYLASNFSVAFRITLNGLIIFALFCRLSDWNRNGYTQIYTYIFSYLKIILFSGKFQENRDVSNKQHFGLKYQSFQYFTNVHILSHRNVYVVAKKKNGLQSCTEVDAPKNTLLIRICRGVYR